MNNIFDDKLIVQRIKNVIKEYRKKDIKMSAYKISLNSGMNPSTLNNIMSGKFKDIRFSTITKIAYGLNMSLREFFDDDLFN